MATCQICQENLYALGDSYKVGNNTICLHCGYAITLDDSCSATYIGLDHFDHSFRIHRSFLCPSCRKRISSIKFRCGNTGERVELQKLFGLRGADKNDYRCVVS